MKNYFDNNGTDKDWQEDKGGLFSTSIHRRKYWWEDSVSIFFLMSIGIFGIYYLSKMSEVDKNNDDPKVMSYFTSHSSKSMSVTRQNRELAPLKQANIFIRGEKEVHRQVHFYMEDFNPSFTYHVDFGDQTPRQSLSDDSFTHTYTQTGIYSVRLFSIDEQGEHTVIFSKRLRIRAQ